MFSKSLRSFLILCILFYGEKVKADASSYEKLLEKVSKLEVKVGILENAVELKDKLMKYIIAEQIEETRKYTSAKSNDHPIVAFSAHTNTKVSYAKGETIVFGNVVLNKGNGYNAINGRFRAPESGLYQFMVHVCALSGKNVATAIVHEHTDIAISVQVHHSGNSCGTVTALRMVEKGEDVFVKCTYPTWFKTNAYRRSTFSGVLLHRQ